MRKNGLIECVPNFSEGRNSVKIKQIENSILSVPGVELLSVEMGADTHRTVITFIGPPEAVEEAAFLAIEKAAQLIDMRHHKGVHPRIGATDVCPLIPLSGSSMEECVAIARRLGERVGQQLQIPVYLYEDAALQSGRKNLADIRKGEYEGLFNKIQTPFWKPDFGPAKLSPQAGATVIGARPPLIAYNINLNSMDKQHAEDIAFELRERGRVARFGNPNRTFYYRGKKLTYKKNSFPCGSCEFVSDHFEPLRKHCEDQHQYDLVELLKINNIFDDLPPSDDFLVGKNVYKPGKFKECKAIGWFVEDYQRAQISINLTNFNTTNLFDVFEEARRLAEARGLRVTGSEIVGLVPYQALMETGQYYLKKQGKGIGLPQKDILRAAISSLGLSDVAPFEEEKKILGFPKKSPTLLVQQKVDHFVDEVSRDTPAPGGGSIAALAGSLGAALVSMVTNLTQGKEGTEQKDLLLLELAEKAQNLKNELLDYVDEDTQAFNKYMDARRMPQNTNEEKNLRITAMQDGLKYAVEIPLKTAVKSLETMEVIRSSLPLINPNSLTDAAVGIQAAFVGVQGGIWNVLINLKSIEDSDYCLKKKNEVKELLDSAQKTLQEVVKKVDEILQ